jgi:hypothetical protein
MARSKTPYIDNKKLYTEMIKYITSLAEAKEQGVELPRIPNYIGESILKIANRLSTRPNFIGYSFREEMISDGIENCLMYLHNFNPDKSTNPFAYFTQIIWYAFIRRIQKEQKQQYIKHKSLIESMTMNTLVTLAPDDLTHFSSVYAYMDADKSRDLVNKFEKTNKVKKKTTKTGIELFIGDTDEQCESTGDSPTDD